jgi:hypothetical protein
MDTPTTGTLSAAADADLNVTAREENSPDQGSILRNFSSAQNFSN